MRCLLLFVASFSVTCFTAFAPAPFPRRMKPDAGTADLRAMQGTWVLVCELNNGNREEMTRQCLWHIEQDRLRTTLDGQEGSTSFIKLHGRSTPRCIDLRFRGNESTSQPGKDIVIPGRYLLEGDILKVCLADPNEGQKRRPRDVSGRGASRSVWVFKRQNP